MTKYTFNSTSGTFFKSVKGEVDSYFSEKGLHPAGNGRLYTKSIVLVAMAAGLYTVLVFYTPGVLLSILLCLLFGFNLALLGFNVMHDGGHQSFSRYAWVNQLAAYFLNVLGGNSYFWKIKHNINHHTFTNIEGLDSDIDVKPFMRLHEAQPLHYYHRFQHIYWVFLYGISYLAWIFYEDFQKYFSGKVNANMENKPFTLKEHIVFWVSKVAYVAVYIVIPIVFVGWLPWLTGYLIATFTCGLVISVVFQLAHVVEGTEFHEVGETTEPKEWAVHQVATTANFATSDRALHWLLGGLNFQIEHHLFPRVSHVHYPQISVFVKDACRKYNVKYQEYSSLLEAFASHLIHLRRLGRA